MTREYSFSHAVQKHSKRSVAALKDLPVETKIAHMAH